MSDVRYPDQQPAQQPDPGFGVYQPNQRADGVPPEGRRGKFWPDGDQEWRFDGDIQSAPDWVDKGWAAFEGGPAVAVPVGDPTRQPYTTVVARKGDTIRYKARKSGAFGEYIVDRAPFPDELNAEQPGTKRPAQESGASLEDLLKTGYAKPADLDDDALAQVRARNPQQALNILPYDENFTGSDTQYRGR